MRRCCFRTLAAWWQTATTFQTDLHSPAVIGGGGRLRALTPAEALVEAEFDLLEAESCGDTREAARLRDKCAGLRETMEMDEMIDKL